MLAVVLCHSSSQTVARSRAQLDLEMSGTQNHLRAKWDAVRTGLWLLPSGMFALGVLLAIAMLNVDKVAGPQDGPPSWWLSGGDGQDVSNLLSTLLTSVIAMASIVFSVTVVALSLAANSYGPRLIRTFRSATSTQVTLGIFVMTIVYLLIVLSSVSHRMESQTVPHISVAVGSLFSLGAVLGLLAFIQGLSRLMVADEVVRRVRKELDDAVESLTPLNQSEHAPIPPGVERDFETDAVRVQLPREGYVQAVEFEDLARWAAEHDLTVKLNFRPGDFVVEGDRKVLVYPASIEPDWARREIERFIVSGQERTPTQDLEYAIRLLVEVAVRALSPGINDPFTALAVIDRLRGGLSRLANRSMPTPIVCDAGGEPRVVRRVPTYAGAADMAFNQIRQAGCQKPAVLTHMLEAIGEIAEHIRTQEQRDALVRHARLILETGRRETCQRADIHDIERRFRKAAQALSEAPLARSGSPRQDAPM
ncbi:DUF2254 domain-containing protein [Pelagerythrobacter rhizovicinus]|nr:DUF2254 domain-containing protein [Pelagerythrobacter rhizovicinus]